MQLEVGTIREGKVTGITKFGAFVEIEKGVTGLVHISEISRSFVVDISKFLKCGDIVKVKILSVEDKKLSLSIKQAMDLKTDEKNEHKKFKDENINKKTKENFSSKKQEPSNSFEDMLAKFKRNSEEKMSDIRKNLDGKRSSYSKKR